MNQTPSHIVIVIMENHSYSEIVNSTVTPYIHSLMSDSKSAVFTNSFAVEHPSQPNYLDLYAGGNQGMLTDAVPTGTTSTTGAFTSPNLGRQLIDKGYSFATYSENLPSVGFQGATATGNYARKHNPSANWQGTGTNQIPSSTNQPFTAFPTDFTQLPTVSLVVPNQNNDMHDGTIAQGDTWLQTHIDAYAQWAKSNNSLLILTWDEDDSSQLNQILTVFTGSMIKAGSYGSPRVDHYSILKMIEDLYGLPYATTNVTNATSLISANIWATAVTPTTNYGFYSQTEMTPSGGQAYAQLYWLNTSLASLSLASVVFPTTGSYRIDISGYAVAGTPSINVLINNVSKGSISMNSTKTGIFSLFISSVAAGTYPVKLQLSNFSSGSNHGRINLLYITQTSSTLPLVYPPIDPIPLVPGQILQGNHFGSKHLRGFNLGSNGYNQAGETNQAMVDLVATGANIARCFVQIERPSGDTYQFMAGELTKLATTVSRATSLGFYVVPCIFHDPSLNSDYWGTTASHIARRASIVNLWKTIATTYVGNATVAGYDLVNEPRSNNNYAECIRWQIDMIEAIRAIDANHVCMVECLENDMFASMLPLSYTNIVYSPHGYSTLLITHQGVTGESQANIRNKYPTTTSSANLAAPWGKTQLSLQHDDVRTMTHRFNVPIFIGEFSCVNWAPLNDAGKWTSTEWVNDNITLLEAEGWSWVYHAWRGDYPGWESEIPSSYYNTFTFANATPQSLPGYSTWVANRSGTAPTIVMLEGWFGLNAASVSNGGGTGGVIMIGNPYAQHEAILSCRNDFPTKNGTGNLSINNDYYTMVGTEYIETQVIFPTTGNYRFDLTGHGIANGSATGGWPQIALIIDGVQKGIFTMNNKNPDIWTLNISTIAAGTRKVRLSWINYVSGATNFKAFLCLLYVTRILSTSDNTFVVYPPIDRTQCPVMGQLINSNHFASGHLRGFNIGPGSGTVDSDFVVMANTGANLLSFYLTVVKNTAKDKYVFDVGVLAEADNFLVLAATNKFVVRFVLEVEPHNPEDFWGIPSLKDSLVGIWSTLATRYLGNNYVAAFSPMNEPNATTHMGEYMYLCLRICQAIRLADPNRCLIISFPLTYDIFRLTQPLPFNNCLYEYHSYKDFGITHQGINQPSDIIRTQYPNTTGLGSAYNSTVGPFTKVELSTSLDDVRYFANKFNSPMCVGEFSCVGYAPANSSERYIADSIDLFETEGWAWQFHSFRRYEPWDAEIPPSAWYAHATSFTNAFPNLDIPIGQMDNSRTLSSTAMSTMKSYFAKNKCTTTVTLPVKNKYGTWGNGRYTTDAAWDAQLPYINGFNFRLAWSDIETAAGTFNWTYFDAQLRKAITSGLNVGFMIYTGTSAPIPNNQGDTTAGQAATWLASAPYSVPYFTNSSGTWPYYLNANYLTRWNNMIDNVISHIKNTYSTAEKAQILFFMSAEGSTGDEAPYKGTVPSGADATTHPANFDFTISTSYGTTGSTWDVHKRTMWSHMYSSLASNLPATQLMINQGNDGANFQWLIDNIPHAWAKAGEMTKSYNTAGEEDYVTRLQNFSNSANSYNRVRGEFEGTDSQTWWSSNPKENLFALVCSALHAGVDILNISYATANSNGYLSSGTALNFFTKHAGNRDAITAPYAFCALRDGLDFNDTTRFSQGSFGNVVTQNTSEYTTALASITGSGQPAALISSRETGLLLKVPSGGDIDYRYLNPTRATNIQAAVAGDNYSVILNTDTRDVFSNDYGLNLIPGNYQKFMSQYSPNTTSLPMYRIGSDPSSYFGRFGRQFKISGTGEMFFAIDPDFAIAGDPIQIDVTYYDSGTGVWSINCATCKGKAEIKVVQNTNTNTWKVATTTISTMTLNGDLPNSSDLTLRWHSGANTTFSLIELTNLNKAPASSGGSGGGGNIPAIQTVNWTVDGLARTAQVYQPSGTGLPIVFVFHGHNATAAGFSRKGFHTYMPDAIVVYPQGLKTDSPGDPTALQTGWQHSVGETDFLTGKVDKDLNFYDAMLTTFGPYIDASQVYVHGFSNGGEFLYDCLWVARQSTMRAIGGSSALVNTTSGKTPKPVMHTAGLTDPAVPFNTQQTKFGLIKTLNSCVSIGTLWASGANGVTADLFTSSTSNDSVFLQYDNGHNYPDNVPALISQFFQMFMP